MKSIGLTLQQAREARGMSIEDVARVTRISQSIIRAIEHDDQFRGMAHTFTKGAGPGGSAYNYINPDYFKLIPWIGDGLQPVGYGYESIAANLQTIQRIEAETRDLEADEVLERRQQLIAQVDAQGLIATPANSAFNELVTEAARLSILNDGVTVDIVYGDQPHVQRRWSA